MLGFRDVAGSHSRPLVAYTPFPSAFPYFKAALARTGRPMYFIRGGTGEKLHQSVEGFKAAARDGQAPILFVSLQMAKSWSVSQVTHECYMLGFDWNGHIMVQAEMRLRREGQLWPVFAYYFVHEDTHDMDALMVINGKKRLAKLILDRSRRH